MSLASKREAAIRYLAARRLLATQIDSQFRYTDSRGREMPAPDFLKPRAEEKPADAKVRALKEGSR
jgi:hypothetical protein